MEAKAKTTEVTQAAETAAVVINPIATGKLVNDGLTAEQVTEVLGTVPEGFVRLDDKFNFRTKKVLDEEGNELKDKAFKPDSVKVYFNVPTIDKLFQIATTDSKVAEMLQTLVADQLLAPVKAKIEELYEAGTAATLEVLKDTLASLSVEQAALDFAATGRDTLTDADIDSALAAFALWATKQGREQKKVDVTVQLFKSKFAKIRTNKNLLERCAGVLLEWVTSDQEGIMEQHGKYVSRTSALLEKLMKAEEQDLSADIL